MSDPRLITPLLADHIMGDPISDHHGVRCCPALEKESEEKYIVKIISIPTSRKQLAALLLSGAYSTQEEARLYFRRLAEDAVEEAKTLQKLAKLEGFWGCDGWQMEPTEDGTGYEVYLLSRYGLTLERHLRRHCLTHLAAVNLGLDLCAALSVCRRNGWLYVDLKPENIILSDTKGFLIGDLGFLSLSSLKFTSLPEKYRSAYTAPEIQDAFSTLNPTLDIYAVGRILSLVFNGGVLTEDPLEAPAYADPEMTKLIQKACAEDPLERWQDPEEMAQALVSYMQSHTVNDTPIVPQPEPEEEEPIVEEQAEVEPESDPIVEESPSIEEETTANVESEESEPAPQEAEPSPEETEPEQFVIEGFLFDDTHDEEAAAQLGDEVISEEVSEMLAQADDLIAHKAPDPVVAPDPIDVPIPAPIPTEPEEEAPAQPEEEPEVLPPAPVEPAEEDCLPPARFVSRRKLGILAAVLAVILLLTAGGLGVKYYYDHIYLQYVAGITVNGEEDWVVVTLDTQIDNTLLTVTCTDPYGNRITSPVQNNRADFTQLPSGTAFRIEVHIAEGHQLTGTTGTTYSTDAKTSILYFKASIGKTDGSAMLSFTVQGPDSPGGWLVKFSADGVPERTETCNGHSAMITGLEVGKTYTFRLIPKDPLYLVGGDTMEFTAAAVILPQNLTIHGFENNALLADWTAPADSQVSAWIVRCYNNSGYDTTFTVTEPSISIPDLDISQSYTLDVRAEGMPEGKQATIGANSVTFKELLIDHSDPGKLVVFWRYEGTAPIGWTLTYTVDNGHPVTVSCDKNSFTVETPVPGGSYLFAVQAPSGVDSYGEAVREYQAPAAQAFSGYDVTAEYMDTAMCRKPDADGWDHSDVADEDYTTQFTQGDAAGFVIRLNREYVTSPDEITVTFVLRHGDGTFHGISSTVITWTDLWYEGYCELDLPSLPDVPGDYTAEILFNHCYVTQQPIAFTVSAAE